MFTRVRGDRLSHVHHAPHLAETSLMALPQVQFTILHAIQALYNTRDCIPSACHQLHTHESVCMIMRTTAVTENVFIMLKALLQPQPATSGQPAVTGAS